MPLYEGCQLDFLCWYVYVRSENVLKFSGEVFGHGVFPTPAERTECRSYGLWIIIGNAMDIVRLLHGLGTGFLPLTCYIKGTPTLLLEVLLT